MHYTELVQHFWRRHAWEITVGIIVVFVAFLSYGLGYLSAQSATRTPIIITDVERGK